MRQRSPRGRGAALLYCLFVFLSAGHAPAQEGFPSMQGSGGPTEMARLGNTALFFSSDSGAATMWRSDGTATGTRTIRRFDRYSSARIIKQADEVLFFVTGFALHYSSGGGESYLTLWITDGTEHGTVELDTGSAPYYGSNVPQGIRQPSPGSCSFTVIGGNGLYFIVKTQSGLDGEHPRSELLSYRRHAQSPRLVHQAPGASHIALLAVDHGRLYFSIRNEIWSSDGEAAARLLEYNYQSYYPYGIQELQIEDRYFHVKADGVHGMELWLRHEGGDSMLKDINPGINSSDPSGFAEYGGCLVFSAGTLEQGRELWISDGTEEGTRMLRDIAAGQEDSSPDQFTPIDEGLVFVTRYNSLWRTDGTSEGTVMISPSLTQSAEYRQTPPELDASYIHAASPAGADYGYELHRSDRTGMALIKDINPGSADSDPSGFIRVGDAIFFTADDGSHGRELWITDGTERGTRLVKDINPGSAGIQMQETVPLEDRLCLVSVDSEGAPQLVLTDGTEAGTYALATYPPDSTVTALTAVGRTLFYIVTTYRQSEGRTDTHVTVERFTRTELSATDATPSGARLIMSWEQTGSDSYELPDPFERDERLYQIP